MEATAQKIREAVSTCTMLLGDLGRTSNPDDVADVVAGIKAVQRKLEDIQSDLRQMLEKRCEVKLDAETRTMDNILKLLASFSSQLQVLQKSNRLLRVLRQAGLRKKFESNLVLLHRDISELQLSISRLKENAMKRLESSRLAQQPVAAASSPKPTLRAGPQSPSIRPPGPLPAVPQTVLPPLIPRSPSSVANDVQLPAPTPVVPTQYTRLDMDRLRPHAAPSTEALTVGSQARPEDDPAYDPPASQSGHRSATLTQSSGYSSFEDPAAPASGGLVISEYRGVDELGLGNLSAVPAPAVFETSGQYGAFDGSLLGAAEMPAAAAAAVPSSQYGSFDGSALLAQAAPARTVSGNNEYGSFEGLALQGGGSSSAVRTLGNNEYGSFDGLLPAQSASGGGVQYGSFGGLETHPSQQGKPASHGGVEYGSFEGLGDALAPNRGGGGGHQYGSFDAEVEMSAAASIVHVDGRQFWQQAIGNEYHVDGPRFYDALAQSLGEPISAVERDVLAELLGEPVSAHKFSEFLKGFGPLSRCVQNLRAVFSQPWFHGFVNGNESGLLCDGEPPGTYFVRFSNSRTSAFVLVFVDRNRHVVQTLVESNHPKAGVKISERQANGHDVVKEFGSIFDVMDYYAKSLKYAFSSEILEHEWFHGDLTSDEALELLTDRPVGTFLLRFSNQRGCYSSSFVTLRNGQSMVMHTRIVKTADGYCEPSSRQAWPSLAQLVASNSELLRYPLANPRFVLRRMAGSTSNPGGLTSNVQAPLTMQSYVSVPEGVSSFSPANAVPSGGLASLSSSNLSSSGRLKPQKAPPRAPGAAPSSDTQYVQLGALHQNPSLHQ